MSNSAQQTRELVSGAITMIDNAVNNELSLSAQFCVGCLLSVKESLAKVLAVPLRECDVGSADEQYKRFKKFCFDNMGDGMNEPRCSKCPLGKSKSSCKFDWGQMPYTESWVVE